MFQLSFGVFLRFDGPLDAGLSLFAVCLRAGDDSAAFLPLDSAFLFSDISTAGLFCLFSLFLALESLLSSLLVSDLLVGLLAGDFALSLTSVDSLLVFSEGLLAVVC